MYIKRKLLFCAKDGLVPKARQGDEITTHLTSNFELSHGATLVQQEHILQLMTDVLDRAIKLVGACETSSSIDSHKTNSFLNSAFDVWIKVLIILTETNAIPRPAKSPPPVLND